MLIPGQFPRFSNEDNAPFADTKRFDELLPGERFKALITDIKPGQVTIRLDGGGFFTARTLILPEARIGEESVFAVKENNFKGQILLEMVKLDAGTKQSNMIRDALINAGLFVNSDNVNIGKALLQNHLPVDALTLQKAVFFMYVTPDMKPEEMVFLLRAGLPAGAETAEAFRRITDEPKSLLNRLTALSFPLLKINAKPAQTRVLNKYFNDLLEFLNTRENQIKTEGKRPENALQSKLIHEVKEQLRFMEQLNQHREYYQIPFAAEPQNHPRQAELFIFKDRHTDGEVKRRSSALVALDTQSLGRVEVFIVKSDKDARLQFRCDEQPLRVISAEAHRLSAALKEKGVNISGIDYQQLTEPFTLLSPEPGKNASDKTEERGGIPTRFTFDMRV